MKDKFVLGENISQTASFVVSGTADVGVVALSLALSPNMKNKGRYGEIPTTEYPPIEQACVILSTTPEYLAFDGKNMWVTNSGSNNVTKLSLNGAVLGTFALQTDPLGIAFDGANMWVANHGINTVTKLQVSNGTVIGNFAVGQNP